MNANLYANSKYTQQLQQEREKTVSSSLVGLLCVRQRLVDRHCQLLWSPNFRPATDVANVNPLLNWLLVSFCPISECRISSVSPKVHLLVNSCFRSLQKTALSVFSRTGSGSQPAIGATCTQSNTISVNTTSAIFPSFTLKGH